VEPVSKENVMGIFKKARPDAYRIFLGRNEAVDVVVLGDGTKYEVHVSGRKKDRCTGGACTRCAVGDRTYTQTLLPVALIGDSGQVELRSIDLSRRAMDDVFRLDDNVDLSTKVLKFAIEAGPDGKYTSTFVVVRDLTADEIAKIKSIPESAVRNATATTDDVDPFA